MSATVYYDNPDEAVAITPVQFVSLSGAAADPASVTCVVTDPLGNITTWTYGSGGSLNAIARSGTGSYSLTLDGLTAGGLWSFVWIGSGAGVQQVTPGSFRVVPLSAVGTGKQYWYTGMEELKSRLGIADSGSDYEMQLAIQAVTNWINEYCGEHFYQLAETRTYMPASIWEVDTDAIVSAPAVVAATDVRVDQDGDGIYEDDWGAPFTGQYVLRLGSDGNSSQNYNVNARGVPRPYRNLQVTIGQDGEAAGGQFLPFVWPFTYMNRVQITTTWGWPVVPPDVDQASLMLCTDMFKSKDVAWGVAGMGDLGMVKVQSNPWVVELLRPYINTAKKVGV